MQANVARLPVVGVMGSHRWEHADRAEAVGRLVARKGCHLLTGGGRGVMAAACRGFAAVRGRKGLSIGVLPSLTDDARAGAPTGYPNPWVELPVLTHLPYSGAQGSGPRSRNHINILSSACVILLPGGPGTRSEAELGQLYGAPTIAFLRDAKELPGLPAGVPITDDIGALESFLDQAIVQ